MSTDLRLVTRLLARERQRAVPIATCRAVAVRPDALVVAPLAMAGHDHTVHALALGALDRDVAVRSVPDPRHWSDQKDLLAWFAQELGAYVQRCAETGGFPQIWVASDAVAAHLDGLADGLRFSKEPTLRTLGETLAFLTERQPLAGQQGLQVAATVLRAHWATGQRPEEDHHLGVLLTWLDPPTETPLADALAAAEDVPMGITPDAEFDRDVLGPWVEQHRRARHAGDVPLATEARAAIHAELAAMVRVIAQTTQRAAARFAQALPEAPDLRDLVDREARDFAWWLAGRAEGYAMPLRDKPKDAAYRLAAREDALEQHAAARIHADAVARADAALRGEVLCGEVQNVQTRKVGRKTVCTFEIVSVQPVLRLRARDELCWLEHGRITAAVTHVTRDGATTRVALRVQSGIRQAAALVADTPTTWGPNAPDWRWIDRARTQMKTRLAVMPWTHAAEPMPAATPTNQPRPGDVLAAVEGLR